MRHRTYVGLSAIRHDDKFRYDVHEDELLPVTIHTLSTVSELWGGSSFIKSADKTDKIDTRIITDFYLEGTNKVEADGTRTVATDYNLLWTRTDKINQVTNLEDHVTDQSIVGAVLISNAFAGTIADTTSTLVRSAIAFRDVSPTKNRFKVDFETDLTGGTTWSSWTTNDLNGTDATAPGITTHIKILANSSQLGTVTFGANVNGTSLRTDDTTTTSATSSTSHDSGGSTFSTTVVDMDAVGDSKAPNSQEHVENKSNVNEVSTALWTTHSWTQGSLPVGGYWSYDEGMNYQVDGFEDTKYDVSGKGNSTVTTSPDLGVTETTVQTGSQGSKGKTNYIGSANGSWSQVSGVVTAHDFSTYTLTSEDHSTTDSKTNFTRLDNRNSGTVTNNTAQAKFSSITDSKGEDKSTKIYDEIAGHITRSETADTKLVPTIQISLD